MKRFGLVFLLLALPLGAQTPSDNHSAAQAPAGANTAPHKEPDRAAAYYHYSLAHNYEELVAMYGKQEFASKAIEEYKLALENDPGSEYLNSGLAELYARTNRIRDAVLEAQSILKRDPNNLDARKLLGRIYLRSLGDTNTGTQSQEMLRLAIEQYEQIVKIEPKSTENQLLLGRLYMLNKDMAKAEAAFKTALKNQPGSEEAVTNLAYLYNEQGDTTKAAQVLSSMPDSSRSAKVYLALGYTYEQQHDSKRAIDAYRKATALDKDNLDALRGLAQNLLNDGQVDQSLMVYKQIVEDDPTDAQAQLRLAEIYRRTRKYDLALESLKKAEALVQDSLEVPYNFALVYAAQGKYEDAISTLSTLLDKTTRPDAKYNSSEANNRAIFLEKLGSLYRETNKLQQAVETFKKMLDLGDENAIHGYEEMIDTLRDDKQWAQATQVAKEAVAAYPKDRGLKMAYAGQLADSGKAQEGIDTAKSLLTGKKEDREIYAGLANLYIRLKMWKEAEEAAAQAEKLSVTKEEKDFVYYLQGAIFERQKQYEKAEERFRTVINDDPQNAGALNYLGYMLADRGLRLDEAVNLIHKALDSDPQSAAYLDSLGWAYFKQGKYDLAEENLRKAVSRQDNDATLHDHLGDLYQKTGRLKLAAAHWERALEEYNRTIPTEVDADELAKVQKKLESAKVKLAKQEKQ